MPHKFLEKTVRNSREPFIKIPEATLKDPFDDNALLKVWNEYSDDQLRDAIAAARITWEARLRALELRLNLRQQAA